jgi:uncharacterized protein (DUF302 family)
MKYGYARTVDRSVSEVIEKVTETLGERGFGVLTSIDVKDTLKKKLDLDRRPYVILGACNPNFAHQALDEELNLGLLMPCNVVVYETDDGSTTVAAIDVHAMVSVVGNEKLDEFAGAVDELLRAAIDAV